MHSINYERERLLHGLKNARLKGKIIGRKKTRPSEMIRALLNSGMSHRAAARVAGCSHGSISLERRCMKQEASQKLESENVKEQTEDPIIVENKIPTVNW